MRTLRPRKPRKKEWRSTSSMPPAKDYFSWLDNPWVQNLTIALLIVAVGFFAQHATVGLVLLGLYAPASLLLRLPSEITFKVALLGLVALPVLTLAGQPELVGMYAQYVFLLLVIGIAGALLEQSRHKITEVDLPVRARSKLRGGSAISVIKLKNMQLMQGWETT